MTRMTRMAEQGEGVWLRAAVLALGSGNSHELHALHELRSNVNVWGAKQPCSRIRRQLDETRLQSI
jgi:hypothetical protein